MSDLTKHIYAIKNIVSRGPVSDDFNYSDRFIGHLLKVTRNRLIKQKLDKYNAISPYAYQDLCLTLERGQYSYCPNLPTTSCFILKSVNELPEILSPRWGYAAKVTYVDGRELSSTNLTSNEYKKYSLLNNVSLKDKWFIHNKKLFILSDQDYLQKILITAVFEDPEEVFDSNQSGCPTAGQEVDFTIDPELVDPMYEMVLKSIGFSHQFARDDENNAKSIEQIQQDPLN